ncbi:general substrate transporter [Mollisia scopiformis]|uniref:General substrate transporter n=1 Tax=Mollisia scopiformis TaxID=149040 RepID=A0A132B7C8_MOLSC|nr:general substrate transporter [Mollisia scopiformis]KUJ07784.1 general substrate transporter [Mollisia scopiformis]
MDHSPKYLGMRGARLKVAMVLLVVAPSFLLFGYNNGSTGGILTLESFVHQFPKLDTVNTKGSVKAHNSLVKGAVTAAYDLGAVFGSLSCIMYSDKIGRIRTILAGLILAIIALAIESSAYTVAQFTIGRVLVGWAIGTISASVPVWQTECSTTKHRGAFVILEGLCISAGITTSEWVTYAFTFAFSSSAEWRVPLVLPVVFALFVMPFLFFMPESPRWLCQGRLEEARRTLAALADEDLYSLDVSAEMDRIQLSLESSRGSLKLLLTNGKERYLHRTILAMTDLGFKANKSRILSCTLVTAQTCCSLIPLFTVDRFGRRKLLMFSAAGLAVCMAVMAGTGGSSTTASAAVVFIYLYDFFYPIGFLGLTFLYATEIAPIRMRVPITAIANATQWLCQFVVGQISPPGTTNLSNRYWIIFAVLNVSFVPIVFFFFPETNGRSLEEIDHIFENSHVFNVVSTARKLPYQTNQDLEDMLHDKAGQEQPKHVEDTDTDKEGGKMSKA